MFSIIIVSLISSSICIFTAVIIGSEVLRRMWRRSVCLSFRSRRRV